jgi:SDR family mycofactocin-dependent oxidoreductase
MGRLDGKVAFITGAARGQGRSHAVRLATEGADVILCDICGPVGTSMIRPAAPSDLEQTVKDVEATGRRVVSEIVDVRDQAGLRALADRGARELGHIDVVVANAGILNWAKTHELNEAQWQDVIDVNLTGVYNTVEATLPHLLKQGTGGSIIVTSSSAGLKGQPFTLSYTAAKHGIVGIVNALAIEYGDYNIRANSIHPCGVRTDMGDAPGLMELINERAATIGPTFMNTLPIDFVEPEDISATVAYLASDDSRWVTGVQLKVDAGLVGR